MPLRHKCTATLNLQHLGVDLTEQRTQRVGHIAIMITIPRYNNCLNKPDYN